jgi:hypothetical protein
MAITKMIKAISQNVHYTRSIPFTFNSILILLIGVYGTIKSGCEYRLY